MRQVPKWILRVGTVRGKIPPTRIPKDIPWELLRILILEFERLTPEIAELLDTKSLHACVRRRDWAAYFELGDTFSLQSIARKDYSPTSVKLAMLLVSVLRKYPDCHVTQQQRSERAMEIFYSSEDHCRDINNQGIPDRLSYCTRDVMRRFLRDVLGPVPEHVFRSYGRHGNGATLDLPRRFRSLYYKYSSWPYSVSKPALGFLADVIKNDARWYGALENSVRQENQVEMYNILRHDWLDTCFNLVDMNRVVTVPKDGRKDRTIAIEPTGNVYLQLALDDYIKRRLRDIIGIDLRSQVRNQVLARQGSLTDQLATIDLSSASDTTSLALIDDLFPTDWKSILYQLRSPSGLLPDGKRIMYEKISSMGNGYTFVIETLLFAAAVFAASVKRATQLNNLNWAIYGDDIICPSHLADDVLSNLVGMGYIPNKEKTLTSGFTRESCGTDWYKGFNVRPIYMRNCLRTVQELYEFHNQLSYWWWRTYGDLLPSSITSKFASWLPRGWDLYGPPSLNEMRSYLHTSVWSKSYLKLVEVSKPTSGRHDFFFRKLMHDLKSCESESGTRFMPSCKTEHKLVREASTHLWWGEYPY